MLNKTGSGSFQTSVASGEAVLEVQAYQNTASDTYLIRGQASIGGLTDTVLLATDGSLTLGQYDNAATTTKGVLLDINTRSAQLYMQCDSGYGLNNSAIEIFAGNVSKWKVTYGGTASYSNVIFNLEADDDTKYTATTNEDGEQTLVYNGAVLDVKDRLTKADAALVALKSAAAAATDFASLKSAIATALANI